MAIQRQVIRQRDFSAGEVDESAARRDDTEIHKAGLKRARNVRPLTTGALTRRPGRTTRYFDGGRHDIVRPTSEVTFDVTFAANRFTARLLGGGVVATLVAPWGEDIVDELIWEPYGRRILVTHRSITPQWLEYNEVTETWTIFDFAFQVGLNGELRMPFYRFADIGVTLRPSARSGSITLTASAPVFVSAHIGTRFLWVNKQVTITAVTDSTHATATVAGTLPPTYRVPVTSSSGFLIGEIVEADVSNARGEVVAIPDSTHLDIIIYNRELGVVETDIIVGSNAQTDVTGGAGDDVIIASAATTTWKEQFMSDYRGWPGSVFFDVSRMGLCDFAQLENAIIWTGINAFEDLEVTGAADRAIFELVPTLCRVLFVVGGSDEFVFTDSGVYTIPISGTAPLAPGSVEFRRIGSAGVARIKPVAVADGAIFIGQTTTRVYAIVGGGTAERPRWEIRHINPFHQELFNSPVAVSVSEGDSLANPGKAVYIVNADGTVVVGNGNPGDDYIGWFLWNGEGAVLGVASRYGEVIFTVRYMLDSGIVDVVESIDDAMKLDGSIPLIDFVGTDPFRDSTGDTIDDSTGEPIYAESGVLLPFANQTLQGVTTDGFYLGDVDVDSDGRVDIDGANLEAVILGYNFTPLVQPFLGAFEGGQDVGQRLRRRKVGKGLIAVKDTHSFRVNGKTYNSYIQGEDWGAAPTARTDTYRFRQRGRSYEPDTEIDQPVPGQFTMTELTVQITV